MVTGGVQGIRSLALSGDLISPAAAPLTPRMQLCGFPWLHHYNLYDNVPSRKSLTWFDTSIVVYMQSFPIYLCCYPAWNKTLLVLRPILQDMFVGHRCSFSKSVQMPKIVDIVATAQTNITASFQFCFQYIGVATSNLELFVLYYGLEPSNYVYYRQQEQPPCIQQQLGLYLGVLCSFKKKG